MKQRTAVILMAVLGVLNFHGAAASWGQTPDSTQSTVPEDPPPVLTVPEGYRYQPDGRRDPFVNPVPRPPAEAQPVPVVRPPGLAGVLVAEAVLAGLVTGREPELNRVVIVAPGNRTYFAARGDALFDAVIKEIRTDAVVFTMTGTGGTQRASSPGPNREIVRSIRPAAGENQ